MDDDEMERLEQLAQREAERSALCLSSDDSSSDEGNEPEMFRGSAARAGSRPRAAVMNAVLASSDSEPEESSESESDSDSEHAPTARFGPSRQEGAELSSDDDDDGESSGEDDEAEEDEGEGDSGGAEDGGDGTEEMSFEERLEARKNGDSGQRGNSRSALKQRRTRRFKRSHKNAPLEQTSKKAVGRFREVVQVKKVVRRDPRFDSMAGTINETHHRAAFGFLDGVRAKEITEMKKRLAKMKKRAANIRANGGEETEESYEARMALQAKLTQHQQQAKSVARSDDAREQRQRWKRRQRQAVKAGKNPYFPKKRELREEALTRKFHQMKKSGGIDKFIARKRQKHVQRDRKKMPRTMRG
jgi:ribosomal RNA-processing protein 36